MTAVSRESLPNGRSETERSVIESGMFRTVMAVPSIALPCMLTMDPRSMVWREEQSVNTPEVRTSTLSGMVTLVREEQFWKA